MRKNPHALAQDERLEAKADQMTEIPRLTGRCAKCGYTLENVTARQWRHRYEQHKRRCTDASNQ